MRYWPSITPAVLCQVALTIHRRENWLTLSLQLITKGADHELVITCKCYFCLDNMIISEYRNQDLEAGVTEMNDLYFIPRKTCYGYSYHQTNFWIVIQNKLV